ncbi:phosphopantetheine-binding protein [Actinophytocola sp.]|uniref:phosphopantetheine-binding protein n=1 Tax=Actinophytocola sp. TaxID=1872138 RepID=UPI002D34BF2E|nr:phosphopantetheine-binding protein [Actinophytocola sp.]HYQ66220.1 phosphopantetheine-binding protein [Actinophytocola sp.]
MNLYGVMPEVEVVEENGAAVAEMVAEAWRDVLGCPGPSEEDNFFELGGHSLAGARVMSRLQPSVHGRLTMRMLFDNPVFGEFVAAVTRLAAR